MVIEYNPDSRSMCFCLWDGTPEEPNVHGSFKE